MGQQEKVKYAHVVSAQSQNKQRMRKLLKLATGKSSINLFEVESPGTTIDGLKLGDMTRCVSLQTHASLLEEVQLPHGLTPVKHFYAEGMHLLVLQEVEKCA